MIKEFALDPICLNSWDTFRYFYDHFGISNGRLISEFPKKWKRMVYDACAGCGDIEKTKITERLKHIEIKLLKQSRFYDGTLQWLENAEAQQASANPFHAIISSDNPRNSKHVLRSADLHDGYDQWCVAREVAVGRTADELAKAITPLIVVAKEIIFVDPHFGPEMSRYRRTLSAFLNPLKPRIGSIDRIEYHLESRASLAFFSEVCERELIKLIPKGLSVKFIRWRQICQGDQLHPRYVLTSEGGIRIESGLDDGTVGETTDISLLDDNLYRERWSQYQLSTAAFDFMDELIVIGRA